MVVQLIPTERLILTLLEHNPGSSLKRLAEATGSLTPKFLFGAIRILMLAGYIIERDGTRHTHCLFQTATVFHA